MTDAIALENYSGDAILDGMAPAEIYVPETWTPEYVEHRLVRAFDIIRTTEGYIGPGVFKTSWKEYVLDYSEVPERPARPSAFEIELMEECLGWPSMIDNPVLRDAVLLKTSHKAAGSDPKRVVSRRARGIEPVADRLLEQRRRDARIAAQKDVEGWMARKYQERQIALDGPSERLRRVGLLNDQGEERFLRATKRIDAMRRDLSEVWPGKVVSVRAFDGFVKDGLEYLSAKLNWIGAPVR